MTISSSTIAAIQKLGAQAFAAKEKLVASTNDYAEKVTAAMKKNPHDPAIAELQTAWQAVAQISKSLENIEDELAKAYAAASRLVKSDPLAAIKVGAQVVKDVAQDAIAKVKGTRTATKEDKPAGKRGPKAKVKTADAASAVVPVEKAKKKVVAKKTRAKAAKPVNAAIKEGSNPDKLFKQLETLLNVNDFSEVNQSEVAKAAGIPTGSMTAAFKKLTDTGRIVAGEKANAFKLPAPAPQSTVES
jgi:hypothetical protein